MRSPTVPIYRVAPPGELVEADAARQGSIHTVLRGRDGAGHGPPREIVPRRAPRHVREEPPPCRCDSVADTTRYVGRDRARTVACPRCGAKIGEYCEGIKGPRVSNHPERAQARLDLDDRGSAATGLAGPEPA
jgi:hypothetical protein